MPNTPPFVKKMQSYQTGAHPQDTDGVDTLKGVYPKAASPNDETGASEPTKDNSFVERMKANQINPEDFSPEEW